MRALCAIDLTEDEEDVADDLQEARAWLERLEATVDLLFVEPPMPEILRPVPGADQKELAALLLAAAMRRDQTLQQQLDGLLEAWPAERRGLAHLSHETGVADEITRRAAHYGLVVVGTHGRRGLTRAWLGSVAEKVVRASPASVLVVRGRPPAPGVVPVLAAVDSWDPGAERVVDEAARWAGRIGGRVDLLHALDIPIPLEPTAMTTVSSGRQLDALLRDAEKRVEELRQRVPADVRGTARVVWGDASIAVGSAAPEYGLVVVGTHGRAGLGRLWLGSVAERVVRRSPGPVLVVPTRE